jgi:hypothetical protein
MKAYCTFLALFLLLLMSCKSSKNNATESEIKVLQALVENKNYTIESNWAYPQVTFALQQVLSSGLLQPGSNVNAIDLMGNANFLTISGDSINAYLPYFGERQMHVDYGGRDGGIKLSGVLENYTTTKSKNNSYTIQFDAKSDLEAYNIFILLYPSLNSEIRVNSSSRFPISYRGRVEAFK